MTFTKKIRSKFKPVKEVPDEFKARMWTEIVLFALAAPASITFFIFDLKTVSAALLLASLFLIGDMARLYYYGYMGHYKILSGRCMQLVKHKGPFHSHTEIFWDDPISGFVYNTWTNKQTTATEGCQVQAIVPENFNFRESDGIRHINTLFIKIKSEEAVPEEVETLDN